MLSGSQRTLESSYCRGLGAHALGDLGLGQPRILACLEQGILQDAFFAFDSLDLGAYARAAQQFLYELIMCLHV